MIEAVRAAVDGRAAFRARPFALGLAGEMIQRSLSSVCVHQGRLDLQWSADQGFPLTWPKAALWLVDVDGLKYRHCVTLKESAEGVRITAGWFDEVVRNVEALESCLSRIEQAVAEELSRPDMFEPGRSYRVLKPVTLGMQDLKPGDVLSFVKLEHVAYESRSIYRFRKAGEPGEDVLIADTEPLVQTIHEWLAPVSQGERPPPAG
jgi:hypothetical protein